MEATSASVSISTVLDRSCLVNEQVHDHHRASSRSTRWCLALALASATSGCGEIREVLLPGDDTAGDADTHEPTNDDTSTGTEPGSSSTAPDIDSAESTTATTDEPDSTGEPSPTTSYCNEEGALVPDGGSVETTIMVPDPSGATSASIGVRVSHPRVSELRVELEVDGTTVSLLDQPACEGSDVDAFFLDEAVPVGNDQCLRGRSAAILGEVAPLRPLAPLLGAAPGPWTLRVTDLAPGEAGQVLRWCVRLTR